MGSVVTGRLSSSRDRPRPLLVVGVWCAGGALLLGLSVLVGWLAQTGWANGVDAGWLERVTRLRSPDATAALRAVTLLGDPWVLLPATGIATAVLAWRRHADSAFLLVTSGAGAMALTVVAKWLVARERPGHGVLVATQGFALPSTHSALVVACLGALAIALGGVRPSRGRRVAPWAAVAALSAAVGFSRVYLGAHWPSDVVLGWLIGAAWLAVCAAATGALLPAHRPEEVTRHGRGHRAVRPGDHAAVGAGVEGRSAADPVPTGSVEPTGGQAAGRGS